MKRLLVVAIIGIGVTGACGKGGSSSSSPSSPSTPPTTTNRNPTIASMSFTPSFGIQSLTTYSFSVSATDPDGDALTYSWNIAGNAATGASGTIVFSEGGNGTARVTVSDGRGGTATDSRTFVVGSMTGTWDGTSGPAALGTFRFTLVQTGNRITGDYWDSTYGSGRIDPAEPGTIDAGGNVQMRVKQGPYSDWYFNGTMASTGATVSGTVRGSGFTGQPFSIAKR